MASTENSTPTDTAQHTPGPMEQWAEKFCEAEPPLRHWKNRDGQTLLAFAREQDRLYADMRAALEKAQRCIDELLSRLSGADYPTSHRKEFEPDIAEITAVLARVKGGQR